MSSGRTAAPTQGTTPSPIRRFVPLIVTTVVLVVLVVAFLIADGIARNYAEKQIESKFRTALSIPKSTAVKATVTGPGVLFQMSSGKLNEVVVTANGLSVGALSGNATLTQRGVPLDQSQPIDSVELSFSTNEAGLKKLLASFPDIPVDSVALTSRAVQLGTSVKVLGLTIPVSISAKPAALNGQLTLQPTAFRVNGANFTPEAVTKTFGKLADGVTKTQVVCVASLLPSAFKLHSIDVQHNRITLGVSAANVKLDSTLFATEGTCPGA